MVNGPLDRPTEDDRPPVPHWEPPSPALPHPSFEDRVLPPVPYWEPTRHDPLRDEWHDRAAQHQAQQRVTAPRGRPGSVRTGVVMGCVGGGLLILAGLALVAVAVSTALFRLLGDDLASMFDIADLDAATQHAVVLLTGAVGVFLGTAPVVFAVIAFHGHNWARVTFTVVAGGYAVVMLLGLFAGLGGNIIAAGWFVGAIAAFWRGSSSEWYDARALRS